MKFFLDMNISLPIIIVSDITIVVVTNLSTLGALFRHLKSPLKNYFNSLLLEDLFIKIKRKPMSLRTELHRIIVTKYRSSRLQRYKNSFFYKTLRKALVKTPQGANHKKAQGEELFKTRIFDAVNLKPISARF